MPNMLDYMRWRGDLTLESAPLNAVDALILSWLASMPIHDAPTVGGLLEGTELSENGAAFARLLKRSDRFRDLKVLRFEEKLDEREEMQFAGLALDLGGSVLIAFRGTDGSLTGWKEDFNLAFSDEVPAQREAARFLGLLARETGKPIRVAGHSKGGNLAVYAAAMANESVRARVARVYNFDGPGVNERVAAAAGFRAVAPVTETYLPQGSLVGILLEQAEEYTVVRSDAMGLMQHDPFSWQVMGGGFETVPELSRASVCADHTLRDWMARMSFDERQQMIEALYDIVQSTKASSLSEIAENWRGSGMAMLDKFRSMDLRTKTVLFISLAKLFRALSENIRCEG